MKKIPALLLTALLLGSSLFAKEGLLSFSAGISSGLPVYGANSVLSTGTEIPNGNRMIIGGLSSVNLNILPQISFYLGNDLLWDITWNSAEKSSKLHVSFPLGIKIFPGIGGLNFGIAYTLGFRVDNIKTSSVGEYNDISSWGNGFKLHVEYDFAHDGKSKHYPSVGTYWNLMPRGNNSWDNLIVLYIAANF